MKNKDYKKELLSKRTRKRLTGMVLQKVSKREDAEEIVQETLISAWEALPSFDGKAKLYTWMYQIARHEIADFYRKKKIKKIVFSRLPFLKEVVDKALGPELQYQELEAKRKILKTLKKISEGYSKILRLKYIEGLSMKEIALRLDVSVKAVESKLSRARRAFEKEYAIRPARTNDQESGAGWFTAFG